MLQESLVKVGLVVFIAVCSKMEQKWLSS
ncbi:hypothetical protein RJ639_023522 [Escallonia herrerae]|uniref:Uncharacterized protein n=1 Tax=Escallonia herrerae TaxID=1293975 RepID=A0AA88UZV7_9ASTE|nr:hypothetical protein RJ639_023522 [Escallonia herrerae]